MRNKYTFRTLLLFPLLFNAHAPCIGQRPPWLREPYLRPAIFGRVFDSATATPLAHVPIGMSDAIGLSFSDTLGWYLKFDIPTGPRQFKFYCPTKRLGLMLGQPFTTRTIPIAATTDSSVDFVLSTAGCAEPDLREWQGEFSGHYTSGFEESSFEPCRPFPTFPGTAYEGLKPTVWVTFNKGAADSTIKWPDRGTESYPRFFVRWHAKASGPGSYGHMGAAMYGLNVDRVLEVRRSLPTDCG